MTRAESAEQRAERIARELREATREAAGVLSDVRSVILELRSLIPSEARDAVYRLLSPALAQLADAITTTVHQAQVEVTKEFNETEERLTALLRDLEKSGNVYSVGMPVVEGVKAVDKLLKDVVERNR